MDIDLPTMLLRVRSGEYKQDDRTTKKAAPIGIQPAISWGLKFYTWVSTRPRLFALGQKLAALIGKIWSPRSSWMTLPSVTGWGYSKDFPRPAFTTFRELWKSRDAPTGTQKAMKTADVQISTSGYDSKGTGVQDTESLVARFEAELTALNGAFISCESEELSNRVLSLLQTKKINEILAWEGSHLPTGLTSELQDNGIELIFDLDPEVKAGLTGVVAAVAETGTIVLAHGPGRPASTSLLPDIHLAILQERDIYEKLPQVLHLREIQEASSTVLISGPSRTADIEMTLTIGVHGPEEIFVFCVKG
jgi:L-lactate dehydrogenase complex protein LldG